MILKSVFTALPNHIMSCFRLPKVVTNKLTSAVAQFWLSLEENTKGMTGNHGKNYAIPRMKEACGLKILQI